MRVLMCVLLQADDRGQLWLLFLKGCPRCLSIFFYNIICWHGRGTCVEVRGQLIRMGSLLPPWVLGLKPRSPGLAASTLTGAILPALIFFFFNTGLEFTQ